MKNTRREYPHCPDCNSDVLLRFTEERIEEDSKAVVMDVPELYCPDCQHLAKIPGLDLETLQLGTAPFLQRMQPGQEFRNPIRGTEHRFERFEHLELKYDARDYFYYPRLGGEEQDGFLCPVFFEKDVLVYFNNHPTYRVRIASSSSGSIMKGDESLLSHGFGFNRTGKLFMWIGDIDQDLGGQELARELAIFKAHNVESDHDLASKFFFSQMPANPEEAFYPSDNEREIFRLVDVVNQCFKARFGIPLFKVDIDRLGELYRQPVLEDRPQIFQSFMSLNINLVENLAAEALRTAMLDSGVSKDMYKSEDGNSLRSNKLLQLLLAKVLNDPDPAETMKPFFVLNDLRQLHGHLTDDSFDKDYNKYKVRLGLPTEAADLDVHGRVVDLLIASLTKVKELLQVES